MKDLTSADKAVFHQIGKTSTLLTQTALDALCPTPTLSRSALLARVEALQGEIESLHAELGRSRD